ncbi:sensor domain-containing phosphodiesterase [Shewanella acanthi]|uniref:sensor domain-containing phosphodiesterase n=1 Tax=Shewanella acanthi TaxID=2864212 RepID=UPI001C658EC6|nr:EAL domain-containing protein [Shewanella acanthi]QYJ80408.1 EAL domain-containing protein [Shewanella acanthi]
MKRLQYQQILALVVNSSAKQRGDVVETAELVTQLLTEQLDGVTATVWLFCHQTDSQTAVASCGPLQSRVLQRPASLQSLPHYLNELKTHRHIDACNSQIDPRLFELSGNYFAPSKVLSSLDVAIRINGQLEGVICIERSELTEQWGESEMYLVTEMAGQLALTLATKNHYQDEERLSLFRCATEQSRQLSMFINLQTQTVEYVNQAFEQITGRNRVDCIGVPMRELAFFSQQNALAELTLTDIERGQQVKGETQLSRADGTQYWLKYTVSQFTTNLGNQYALVTAQENSGEHHYKAHLERLAWHCSLTGLNNRSHFNLALEGCTKGLLFLIDIVGFKRFNDTYGHTNGDSLLVEIARRLKHFAQINQAWEIARLGSDEFAILLSDASAFPDLQTFTTQLYRHLAMPVLIGRERIEPKTAIAVVDLAAVANVFAPLTCADIALQYAKKKKIMAIQIFNSTLLRAFKEDAQIERDLHNAIRGRQFELYYQPLRDLEQQSFTGAEALIRWHHPQKGVLYPGAFIDIAEQSGMINAIGSWVLEAACRQLNIWQHQNANLSLHVNVSARQFFSGNLFEEVWQLLSRYQLKPKSLILEITETELMADIEQTTLLCQQLAELGVGLAIDDFGTGYSSMRYLKQFPITKLKIDRSFISDLTVSRESREIVSAIIAMANALNISLTAEGVETPEQEAFLAKSLCHQAQGYLYSPALRESDFAQFIHMAAQSATVGNRLTATVH